MNTPQLIEPNFKPINRAEWRKLTNEITRIERHMAGIENEFLQWIFESDESDSYDPTYEKFLEQFQKMAELTEQWVKPKLCRINREYFCQLYFPIENEDKP